MVEGAALTRPRVKVISSAKWEVNMTMKYHVASSAMVARMVGTLRSAAFDFTARKVINENARKSCAHITTRVSRKERHQVQVRGNPDSPYKSRMVVYAISMSLCRMIIHRRYASRGIGGSDRAAHGSSE